MILFRAKKHEAQQEEHRENPDEGTDLSKFSRANLDESKRKKPQAQPRGDAESERRRDRRDECGERFGEIVPVDFCQ